MIKRWKQRKIEKLAQENEQKLRVWFSAHIYWCDLKAGLDCPHEDLRISPLSRNQDWVWCPVCHYGFVSRKGMLR